MSKRLPNIQLQCAHCKCEFEVGGKWRKRKYCSQVCSYSDPAKRAVLSILAKTQTRKPKSPAPRVCPTCEVKFTVQGKAKQIYCSNACSCRDPARFEERSLRAIEKVKNRKDRYHSIRCAFKFQDQVIRCDSKLEFACLDWFVRRHAVNGIQRCTEAIPYDDEGRMRRYLPDFIVQTTEATFIVECKGDIYLQSTNPKWYRYRESVPMKKAALEAFASDRGYATLWFTPHSPGSRYKKLTNAEYGL